MLNYNDHRFVENILSKPWNYFNHKRKITLNHVWLSTSNLILDESLKIIIQCIDIKRCWWNYLQFLKLLTYEKESRISFFVL